MTGAIVVAWGAPVRGREAKSLESFGKAIAHFEQLAKQGRIHGHKEYLSVTGNTSRVGGFMLIEGDLDELLKIQIADDTQRLLAEAGTIVDNLSVQIYAGGSDRAVQERVTMYAETLSAMGIM